MRRRERPGRAARAGVPAATRCRLADRQLGPDPPLGLDLDWIAPRLAVGGRFPAEAAASLAEAGVRAVIDLRSEDRDDEVALRRHGLAFLHLPTDDHCAITQGGLDRGAAFALDHLTQGGGVLIHCREGIGRSVTLALCVLVAQGVEPLSAMSQIKAGRYYASPSPAQFEAWATWMRRRELSPPTFGAFAAIAYRHLAQTAEG